MISKAGCFGLSLILLFCAQEGLHELINLLLGFLQVIVYDHVVKLRGEGQLIACLGKALLDNLRRISILTPPFTSTSKITDSPLASWFSTCDFKVP